MVTRLQAVNRVTTEIAQKEDNSFATRLARLSAMLFFVNFLDRLNWPSQRVSAPQWPLVDIFPLDSPRFSRQSDDGAAGRHRRALEIMEMKAAWRTQVRTRSISIQSCAFQCFRLTPPAGAKPVGRSAYPSTGVAVFGACKDDDARAPVARAGARATPQLGGASTSTL